MAPGCRVRSVHVPVEVASQPLDWRWARLRGILGSEKLGPWLQSQCELGRRGWARHVWGSITAVEACQARDGFQNLLPFKIGGK